MAQKASRDGVLIGKEHGLYAGDWPPGEKANSCPKTKSKVSAWPEDFLKGTSGQLTSKREALRSIIFLGYISVLGDCVLVPGMGKELGKGGRGQVAPEGLVLSLSRKHCMICKYTKKGLVHHSRGVLAENDTKLARGLGQ